LRLKETSGVIQRQHVLHRRSSTVFTFTVSARFFPPIFFLARRTPKPKLASRDR
jgi:hypothetical protein